MIIHAVQYSGTSIIWASFIQISKQTKINFK